MDKNKHKLYMAQILGLIFKDRELCNLLAFKDGTSLMFFHGLTRFSTDLDFNLLDNSKEQLAYDKIRNILTRFGTIDDEAMKTFGPVLVLNYGKGERMLKVEISNRTYDNHYETRTLAGTDIRIMTIPDMFAHKLCAMGERMSPRDVFDVWFFLQKHSEINEHIVKSRTGKSVDEYARQCAEHVRNASPKLLMQGLGDVVDDAKTRKIIRDNLIEDTATALELFATFPLIAQQEPCLRTKLIESNPSFIEYLTLNNIDISTLDEKCIVSIIRDGEQKSIKNKNGDTIVVCNNQKWH